LGQNDSNRNVHQQGEDFAKKETGAVMKGRQDRAGRRGQRGLAKSDPGNAGWQRDRSVSYENVGDVQVAQGDLKAALTGTQYRGPHSQSGCSETLQSAAHRWSLQTLQG
jgi:hypothetical protein